MHWERYTSCNPLPGPDEPSRLQAYISAQSEAELTSVSDTLQRVQDTATVIDEVTFAALVAAQHYKPSDVTRLGATKQSLYALSQQQLNQVTAWFLHHCDYFADAEGNVKCEEANARCQWGIWLNILKNPRLKAVEFPALSFQLDIPKQIALAPVAVRVQVLDSADEHFAECTNEWYAVGDVINVDLLTLPPTAKATANGWVMRTQGTAESKLHVIPYPIPPTGADPNTWQSEEEVPKLGFHTSIKPSVVPLPDTQLEVQSRLLALMLQNIPKETRELRQMTCCLAGAAATTEDERLLAHLHTERQHSVRSIQSDGASSYRWACGTHVLNAGLPTRSAMSPLWMAALHSRPPHLRLLPSSAGATPCCPTAAGASVPLRATAAMLLP